MTVRVLRRVWGLTPQPITSASAPLLGPHIDIEGQDDRGRCGPLTVQPASPDLPSVPPSHLPGICYHHGHIEHEGRRVGVLVLDDDRATVLPCTHVNKAGR